MERRSARQAAAEGPYEMKLKPIAQCGCRALMAAAVTIAAPSAYCRGEVADAESRWAIGIALGYGERSNPLVQSEDIDILVDIDVAWYGERWFFDNGDVGFTMHDGRNLTLNMIGRINSDRVFFSKTDTEYVSLFGFGGQSVERIEIPDRDYAFEVGVELLSDGDWGHLQLAAHHDASDRHGGYEVFASYGRRVRRGRWFIEPSFGFAWKSRALNDYYWGVRLHESSTLLPAYDAGSGFNTHARFVASYQLDRHWTFIVATEHERLSDEAARSPIVAERSVQSGFAGFRYSF
jgi:MipA family protein